MVSGSMTGALESSPVTTLVGGSRSLSLELCSNESPSLRLSVVRSTIKTHSHRGFTALLSRVSSMVQAIQPRSRRSWRSSSTGQTKALDYLLKPLNHVLLLLLFCLAGCPDPEWKELYLDLKAERTELTIMNGDPALEPDCKLRIPFTLRNVGRRGGSRGSQV